MSGIPNLAFACISWGEVIRRSGLPGCRKRPLVRGGCEPRARDRSSQLLVVEAGAGVFVCEIGGFLAPATPDGRASSRDAFLGVKARALTDAARLAPCPLKLVG